VVERAEIGVVVVESSSIVSVATSIFCFDC